MNRTGRGSFKKGLLQNRPKKVGVTILKGLAVPVFCFKIQL